MARDYASQGFDAPEIDTSALERQMGRTADTSGVRNMIGQRVDTSGMQAMAGQRANTDLARGTAGPDRYVASRRSARSDQRRDGYSDRHDDAQSRRTSKQP